MGASGPRLWTIGGGIPGVGKSFVTAQLASALAGIGRRAVALDADPAAADLHRLLGAPSTAATVSDVIEGRAQLDQAVRPSSVPGLTVARMGYDRANSRAALLRALEPLDPEYVVVDAGSTGDPAALDLWNASDEPVVVISEEPAAMHAAYGFLKSAVYRKVESTLGKDPAVVALLADFRGRPSFASNRAMSDFCQRLQASTPEAAVQVAALLDANKTRVVVNRAASEHDTRLASILRAASQKFLQVDLRLAGVIALDPASGGATLPAAGLDEPAPAAARHARQIVLGMLDLGPGIETKPARTAPPSPSDPVMGLNDLIELRGKQLHIQTEDMGSTATFVTTQVFCEGHIILSRKSEYPPSLRAGSGRGEIADRMHKQHLEVMREIETRL